MLPLRFLGFRLLRFVLFLENGGLGTNWLMLNNLHFVDLFLGDLNIFNAEVPMPLFLLCQLRRLLYPYLLGSDALHVRIGKHGRLLSYRVPVQ